MEIKMRDIVGVADTNVRKTTGLTDVTDLANSMEAQGLIHAIEIRPVKKGKYEVTVGQRRYLAAKQLGWREIEAIVRKIDDKQAITRSLIENIERGSLSLEEEAKAYEQMVNLWGSQSEFSRQSRIPQSRISRVLDTYALSIGVGVKPEYRPSAEARERGEEIPYEHVAITKEVYGKKEFEALPKPERRRIFKTIAPLPQRLARKVLERKRMYPTKPVEVLAKEVEEIKTGIHVHVYFDPKVARALEKAADDRNMTVEEVVPIAVEEWLKRVGYYEKD